MLFIINLWFGLLIILPQSIWMTRRPVRGAKDISVVKGNILGGSKLIHKRYIGCRTDSCGYDCVKEKSKRTLPKLFKNVQNFVHRLVRTFGHVRSNFEEPRQMFHILVSLTVAN